MFALSVYILMETRGIARTQAYGQAGPRLFPNLVGAGLAVLAIVLGWQAASGGWRHVPADRQTRGALNSRAALLISAGVVAHMALIGWAGFILAGILLYVLTARAFGSFRLLANLGVAAALATAVFYLFTRALGLSLPAGLLGGF